MNRGIVFAWVVATWAALVGACPVCSGPQPQAVQDAYLGITVLLSALPFVLLGAGWWIARRFRDPRQGGVSPSVGRAASPVLPR